MFVTARIRRSAKAATLALLTSVLVLCGTLVMACAGADTVDTEVSPGFSFQPFADGSEAKCPQAVSTGTAAPCDDVDWTDPANVKKHDGDFATASLAAGDYTYVLRATDFDLDIPTGATIDGIEVEIQRKSSGGQPPRVRDALVQLTKDGTTRVGDNKADTGTDWVPGTQVIEYGGADDLWGETWTASDINAATFGVHFAARNHHARSGHTASVDSTRITVYYTLLPVYDLSISSTDGGSVTVPGEDTFSYGYGTVVDLVAEPDENHHFVEWTGYTDEIADVNEASTTITMYDDYSITANFAINQYTLIYAAGAGGSINGTTPQTVNHGSNGTAVEAVPETGYHFVDWSDSSRDNPRTDTNVTGDITITANFELIPTYELTMVAGPEAGGTATDMNGASPYSEGTEVSIKAEANTGYRFLNWSAPAGVFGDENGEETVFTMPGEAVNVTASFEEMLERLVNAVVTTDPATSITADSATLNMRFAVADNSSVEVRFVHKRNADTVWAETPWVSKSASGSHNATLVGLIGGTVYQFKAQLKCDAVVIEGNVLQFTTDTSSLPPVPPLPSPCFVATAAYGTPTAVQIDVLREFRDAVLLESSAGSRFVAWYYRTSPPIAEFIAGDEVVRTLVRVLFVDPLVRIVDTTGRVWRTGQQTTGVSRAACVSSPFPAWCGGSARQLLMD